tara:strand:- start:756 stop:1259 length:504 start_codon:yes stop_codon:yes gene_type:complete
MEILQEIYEYVNKVYDLKLETKTRKREYAEARALFYFLARKLTKTNYQKIGGFVNRDHTTVIHALKNTIHYVEEQVLVDAVKHFNCIEDLPKDSYAYLEHTVNILKSKLAKKEMVLGLFPKLETVYDGLMVLTSEQTEMVQQMKNLQFDVIQKKLNTVEEIIEQVNG